MASVIVLAVSCRDDGSVSVRIGCKVYLASPSFSKMKWMYFVHDHVMAVFALCQQVSGLLANPLEAQRDGILYNVRVADNFVF